ncbi:MAG TPA: GNAT family protein [Clostridia bacterium]|nr:GNAT family protein [Clostridia bacterium]
MLLRDSVFARLPELSTQRLLLRKMTMADAQDIYDYSSDPEVSRHVLWEAHRTIHDSRAYLRYILRQYRNGEPSSWGIVLSQTNRLIGTIGYMWWNQENHSAEVGYSLARSQWNHGIMTEALWAVLRFGFEEMRLHRIEAQHEVDNPASGRVMEKCGMRREGVLRGRLYNKGRYVDVALYAILVEEWRAIARSEGRFR